MEITQEKIDLIAKIIKSDRKFANNEDLFDKYNKELCTKMKTAFSAAKNDPNRIGKDPTIWENLYMTLNSHINKSSLYKAYDI